MKIETLMKAAEDGNTAAQTELGLIYWNGLKGKSKRRNAAKWFSKAAERGDSFAAYVLSQAYLEGIGVEKNEKKAFEWAKKSAILEYPESDAILAVGWHYLNGIGVSEDIRESERWFLRAVRVGVDSAAYNLGLIYEAKKDYCQALHWYWVSVGLGHKKSLYKLGRAYFLGRGVPKNSKMAKKLLKRAKKEGVATANRLLNSKTFRKSQNKGPGGLTYSPPFEKWCGKWIDDRPIFESFLVTIDGSSYDKMSVEVMDPEDGEVFSVTKSEFEDGYLLIEMKVPSSGKIVRHRMVLVESERIVSIPYRKKGELLLLVRLNETDSGTH